MLVLLFLVVAPFVVVQSFPNSAGSCTGGRPAVGGLHLSYGDGIRHVQSGDFRDSHLRFYVDGSELSMTGRLTVETGTQHTLEIVSSVTSRPFRGALIRVEPQALFSDDVFTLLPMINAAEAEACVDGVQGVSHVDNSPKTVLSAGFTALDQGIYLIDVTVVEANNATGSIYWYSRFIITVEDSGPRPAATPIPASPKPESECFLCGSPSQEVVLFHHKITLNGVQMSCGDMALLGRQRQIGSEACNEAQKIAAKECYCSIPEPVNDQSTDVTPTPFPSFAHPCHVCGEGNVPGDPSADVFFENEIGTCLELFQDGMEGLIPMSKCSFAYLVAKASCACKAPSVASLPTFAPTITSLPTYSASCEICGPNKRVTSTANVVLGDITISCHDLSLEGEGGYIPPDLCLETQKVAMEFCDCSPFPTASPTVTFTPTKTSFPTFSQKCTICPEGQSVAKPDQVIVVGGAVGTCNELEVEGMTGFVAPSACPDAQAAAKMQCGCSPTPAPSALDTMFPTYQSTCYICGSEEMSISLFDVEVVVGGDRGTCRELQEIALGRLLPGEHCLEAKKEASSKCGCTAVSETEPTMQPTVTMYPTYTNECDVCPSGSRVTASSVSVTMDDIVLTCAELEEAGREHVIPPLFCPLAKSIAAASCKCAKRNVPSAALATFSPTVTPLPTLTFTPTFSEKCNICGGSSFITVDHALLSINNMLITCGELVEAAAERMIPPSLCLAAQTKATEACGCREPAHVVLTPTESPVWTFQPTVTAEPTLTSSPTFAARCDVCGVDREVSKANKIVKVAGIVLTCKDLKGAGAKNLIPPDHCAESKHVALSECGCESNIPTPVKTFIPTETSEPTVTPEPSHAGICQVCSNGGRVSDFDAIVAIEGYALSCKSLEEFAVHQQLSFQLCQEAQLQADSFCNCVLPSDFLRGERSDYRQETIRWTLAVSLFILLWI